MMLITRTKAMLNRITKPQCDYRHQTITTTDEPIRTKYTVVGSSRNTIGGLPIRAIAVLNFRLLPPLYPNLIHSNKRD